MIPVCVCFSVSLQLYDEENLNKSSPCVWSPFTLVSTHCFFWVFCCFFSKSLHVSKNHMTIYFPHIFISVLHFLRTTAFQGNEKPLFFVFFNSVQLGS